MDRAAQASWAQASAAAHGSFVEKLMCRVTDRVNDRVRNELEAGIETR